MFIRVYPWSHHLLSVSSSLNKSLAVIAGQIIQCNKCPELRDYCKEVALTKRKAFANETYWGKPVPSFGDHRAKIMVVGLAPAAHGANRTGRMFTGDRSGDFLYAALHRAGLANQPTATHARDGLKLKGVYISASAHCAPPANKPTPMQLASCRQYLVQEISLLQPRVIICLGAIAWNSTLTAMDSLHREQVNTASPNTLPRIPGGKRKPRPKFAHAAEVRLGNTTLLGCYHVSQQNTFTGKLTPKMIDAVLARAMALLVKSIEQ